MRITTDFFFYLSGSFVSAGSVFFLCLGASYLTSILFVVTLSLGEAVYSPRVYEYTMLLSPKVVYPRQPSLHCHSLRAPCGCSAGS